jgi:hypothetical protein
MNTRSDSRSGCTCWEIFTQWNMSGFGAECWRAIQRYTSGDTARHDVANDPIAAALVALAQHQPDRFAMRFSNAPTPFSVPTTISVEHPYQVPNDATLCPQEVDKTESCSTCALCWQSKERISFITH